MKTRYHEITFYYIIEHLRTIIRAEKLPLFLEMFAITFDIDFTNLSILYHQYLPRITPKVKDTALMAHDLGISVRRFPINWNYAYTLIRKHKGEIPQDNIINEALVETLIDFNKKYIKFGEQHPAFFKEVYNDAI